MNAYTALKYFLENMATDAKDVYMIACTWILQYVDYQTTYIVNCSKVQKRKAMRFSGVVYRRAGVVSEAVTEIGSSDRFHTSTFCSFH